MSPSILAIAGVGLLLGFRHAFEPDHLAAVSTLATRQGRLLDACRLGLAWAAGHTVSVGLVVAGVMLFGPRLPPPRWPGAGVLPPLPLIRLGGAPPGRDARGGGHLRARTHAASPPPHPPTPPARAAAGR